jgi:hypothetical protein
MAKTKANATKSWNYDIPCRYRQPWSRSVLVTNGEGIKVLPLILLATTQTPGRAH